MILGIGVDILSLIRFQSFVSRRGIDRIAKRVCSIRELEQFNKLAAGVGLTSNVGDIPTISGKDTNPHAKQIKFLTSRWAIKEAAYKALYPSLPLIKAVHPTFHLGFTSLELSHQRGVPTLKLLAPIARVTSNEGLEGGVGRDVVARQADQESVEGITLLGTISHDAGVVVGVVLAQKNQ